MATWNKEHPEVYSIFHNLWTRAVGTSGYDKEQWLQFELQLATALRTDPEAELPWMVQARAAGWIPESAAYQRVVTLAAHAVKAQPVGEDKNVSLFEVSEILGLTFGKSIESVMSDLISVTLGVYL